MRISEWIPVFNVQVMPTAATPGAPYYKLKDLFTTRDGSWEPSTAPGSIPQWARDTYLKPFGHPDYFDDAGADHHLLGGVFNAMAQRMEKTGFVHYYTHTDDSNHVDMAVKERSGWANIVITAKYDHTMGKQGPWSWYPQGRPADVVRGGGMPGMGWHVSFFATWELTVADTTPPVDDTVARIAKLDTWARAWSVNHPGEPKYT